MSAFHSILLGRNPLIVINVLLMAYELSKWSLRLIFEKSTRYETNFQNRIIKGFSGLAALDQDEVLMRRQPLLASEKEFTALPASTENEGSK